MANDNSQARQPDAVSVHDNMPYSDENMPYADEGDEVIWHILLCKALTDMASNLLLLEC